MQNYKTITNAWKHSVFVYIPHNKNFSAFFQWKEQILSTFYTFPLRFFCKYLSISFQSLALRTATDYVHELPTSNSNINEGLSLVDVLTIVISSFLFFLTGQLRLFSILKFRYKVLFDRKEKRSLLTFKTNIAWCVSIHVYI